MNVSASAPVLSCAEAKAWEVELLRTPLAEWAAMQRAGAAIAPALREDFREIGGLPAAPRLLVFAGKGHNGGDALLAAAALLQEFPRATAAVVFLFPLRQVKPLARRAWQHLRRIGRGRVRVLAARHFSTKGAYDVCLDGLFGFQFRPPAEPGMRTLLAKVNAHPRLRLRAAVDLPSGLSEATGDVVSSSVFRADFTYATGIVKAAVLAAAHAGVVGRVRYLDLGFFAAREPASTTRVLRRELLEPLAALRPAQTDKRKFGHVFVVGGSLSYPGAILLAVRAALHSGVGLLTAFVPAALVPQYAVAHPEVMWVGCPVDRTGGLARGTLALIRTRVKRAQALLIGPGLGASLGSLALVRAIAAFAPVPMVLDADALRPEVIAAVEGKSFICTPHAGELQRIEAALTRAATLTGVIVMKGPLTQVRDVDGTRYFSPFGGPVLARGGSGDILAGLTAGLLAQQPGELALAACRAVVWHGLAADLLARARGQVAVETSQLLEQLGPALSTTTCLSY